MSASPPGHAGMVGGVLNMARGIGIALGVALTGAIYTAAAGVAGARVVDAGVAAAGHGLTAALGIIGLVTLGTAVALLFSDRS